MTKSGFCACVITFQTQSTCGTFVAPNSEETTPRNLPEFGSKLAMPSTACIKTLEVGHVITLCVKHHAMPTYWGTDVYLRAFSVFVLHGRRRSASGHGSLNQERAPAPGKQADCVGSTVRLDTLDQLQRISPALILKRTILAVNRPLYSPTYLPRLLSRHYKCSLLDKP